MAQVGLQLESMWPRKLVYLRWELWCPRCLCDSWIIACCMRLGFIWRFLASLSEPLNYTQCLKLAFLWLSYCGSPCSSCPVGFLYRFPTSARWLENRSSLAHPTQCVLQWRAFFRGWLVCCPRQEPSHTTQEQGHFPYRHYEQSSFP